MFLAAGRAKGTFLFLAAGWAIQASGPPNLELERVPHRRGTSRAIIASLGGAGPLSFVVSVSSFFLEGMSVSGVDWIATHST